MFFLLLLAFLLFGTSCVISDEVPVGTHITCGNNSECPRNWRCSESLGRCVLAGDDETPPAVIADSLQTSRNPVPRGAAVSVAFSVTKPLGREPKVMLEWSHGAILHPTSIVGNELDYVAAFVAHEDTHEGSARLIIDIVDASGNPGSGVFPAALIFDFTPPTLVESTVALQLLPAAGSLVSDVDAITTGASARLLFAVSEALAAPPEVAAQRAGDAHRLSFEIEESIGTFFVYALHFHGGPSDDGTYVLRVTGADLAGNPLEQIAHAPGVLPPEPMELEIDATPPSALNVAAPGLVVYHRSPWGDSTNPEASFSVRGAAGAADTSARWVMAFDRATESGRAVLGQALVQPDGSFGQGPGPLSLGFADRARVYVGALDAAGNLGPVALVEETLWVATLHGKIPGSTVENPHELAEVMLPDASLVGHARRFLPSNEVRSAARVGDGEAFVSESQAAWRARSMAPLLLLVPMATWRNATEELLFLSADASSQIRLWSWREQQWSTLPSTPMSLRVGAGVAYHALHDQALIVGGTNPEGLSEAYNETHVWHGHHMTTVADNLTLPYAVVFPSMVYDAARGETLLYGGISLAVDEECPDGSIPHEDGGCLNSLTWGWDGERWSLKDVEGPGPRAMTAMAYDPSLEQVILYGGCSDSDGDPATCATPANDTWRWNGSDWQLVDTTSSAGGRAGHAMAFDPASRQLVLFGGHASDCEQTGPGMCADLHRLEGDAWLPIEVEGLKPSPQQLAQLFTDHANQRLVFAGNDGAERTHIMQWRDNQWSPLSRGGAQLPERQGAAAAFDAERGVVVVFGGEHFVSGQGFVPIGDLWEWDGVGWTQRCSSPEECALMPEARHSAQMAYDQALGKIVMAGGTVPAANCDGDTACATWGWDGAAWEKLCGPGTACLNIPPSIGAMVYDSEREVTVYVGLDEQGDTTTWVFGEFGSRCPNNPGPCWRRREPAQSPPPREHAALVFDSITGRSLLFGGKSAPPCPAVAEEVPPGDCYYFDVWSFDGATWQRVDDPSSDERPSGRARAYAAFDSMRAALLIHGGERKVYFNDTWEWRPQGWRRLSASGSPPVTIDGNFIYDEIRQVTTLFGGVYFDFNQEQFEFDNRPSRRPALRYEIDTRATAVAAEHLTILDLAVSVVGSGTGFASDTPGTPSHGLEFAVWDAQEPQWTAVQSFTSASDAMDTFSYSPDIDPARLRSPSTGRIYLQMAPRFGQEAGPNAARLQVDGVEAQVRYRITK